MGDKISSSPYVLEMNRNSYCSILCRQGMSEVSCSLSSTDAISELWQGWRGVCKAEDDEFRVLRCTLWLLMWYRIPILTAHEVSVVVVYHQ